MEPNKDCVGTAKAEIILQYNDQVYILQTQSWICDPFKWPDKSESVGDLGSPQMRPWLYLGTWEGFGLELL